MCELGKGQKGKEGAGISSRLPAAHGAQLRALSHDPEILT